MSDDGKEAPEFLGDIEDDQVITDDELSHAPQQHQALKNAIHGASTYTEIKRADRRYLVIGRGRGNARDRRELVRQQLDERISATAFMLEDFGLTGDDIDLWAPAFDILSSLASHVVGVLEDFDGGHVWELGYLYHHQRHVRDILWLLKRVYPTEKEMREQYDNGMAAAHLEALETAANERLVTWRTEEELEGAVDRIP